VNQAALPAHYREAGEAENDLKPTPGLVATESADPEARSDMEKVNEHWRRRKIAARRRR